ncbi:DMT family transporter [Rhodococcus sp. SGAir0479]|uniref:DMT family transporter n=1 Tax=Rhodococcus sp. SGAir0479 TaxID=2567884 RepID=UPI0010CCDFA9|nr:SMR family transporter [Rhodococcus sp. SGAir0479]QCQ91033.1 QacE family quaternary ammonium compound efflux SMR transporter [Rhodococcus sp. SGAir0479]
MTAWMFLFGAIASEIGATMSLRVAALGRPRWYAVVGLGYVAAFALLSAALAHGLGIGVAYGVWSAVGIAATAVLSRIVFREPFTALMGVGVAVIVGGVLLVELGAQSGP